MAKSSRKIRQSLSTISSKDFLLQWRSSNARCLSWSRCFFIRVLKKKGPRVTFTANGKRKFVPRDQVSPFLVVYCFLYLLKCRALGCVSSLKSEIGLKIRIWILVKKRTLRFFDEDDYEYKIFSILSIGQAWTSVILAGKRDSLRHSTTSFSEEVVVAGTSYQMLESFSILVSGEGLTSCSINNPANFFGEKSTVKLSWVSFFVWEHEQKLEVKSRTCTRP